MKTSQQSRYASIPKRSFRNAVVRLLEEDYKLVGSHKDDPVRETPRMEVTATTPPPSHR